MKPVDSERVDTAPDRGEAGPLDPDMVVPWDVFEQMLSDDGDEERRLRDLS